MSTYKVLQDIEAEDKLVWILSFRQCVYAGIAIFSFYLSYLVTSKHAVLLMPFFLLPGLFCLFFAVPWQTHQTTEVWALAKLRFMFKPRGRIWNQSGVKELVKITAPKKVEVNYTNGLSQDEVKSRLQALADTIDSRGWAIKNVGANMYTQMGLATGTASSDRLVGIDSFPQQVPDTAPTKDVMDEQTNPMAQQFDQMLGASRQAQRQQIMAQMQQAAQAPLAVNAPVVAVPQQSAAGTGDSNYWFMNTPSGQQSGQGTIQQPVANLPGPATYGAAAAFNPVQPVSSQQPSFAPQPMPASSPQTVTTPLDPAILELANNNDLNIATIARQANHVQESLQDGEVVINLH